MNTIQEEFDKELKSLIELAKTEEDIDRIKKGLPESFSNLIESLPGPMLLSIKENAYGTGLLNNRRKDSEFLEERLRHWQEGFDVLELLVGVCVEAGSGIRKQMGTKTSSVDIILFDVLTRLHAKACLISKEIVCLLKNGFADGAHGRWRALHEVTVTSLFLSKSEGDTVERYCQHEIVDSYKGACQHKEYASRLQAAPPSDEEILLLKKHYDVAMERFGCDFGTSYGWAEKALKNKRPNFADLEKAVGYDHWRPYYKWASQNVHANAKTITSSLGVNGAMDNILLAGASNLGLVDPAHSMAISLVQNTCAVLAQSPSIDSAVTMKIVGALCDEVGEVFLRCSKAVDV